MQIESRIEFVSYNRISTQPDNAVERVKNIQHMVRDDPLKHTFAKIITSLNPESKEIFPLFPLSLASIGVNECDPTLVNGAVIPKADNKNHVITVQPLTSSHMI